MLKFVCPLVLVEDISRSRKFYETVLGQQALYDFTENITFKGDFAIHQREHFQELLGKPEQYAVTYKAHDGELYFESDEIDILLRKLEESSVEFIHRIREQPWGQRVMRIYDPDGHIIEIGEPMDLVIQRFDKHGLSVEEICKRTSMPIEFVEQTVKERNI